MRKANTRSLKNSLWLKRKSLRITENDVDREFEKRAEVKCELKRKSEYVRRF